MLPPPSPAGAPERAASRFRAVAFSKVCILSISSEVVQPISTESLAASLQDRFLTMALMPHLFDRWHAVFPEDMIPSSVPASHQNDCG